VLSNVVLLAKSKNGVGFMINKLCCLTKHFICLFMILVLLPLPGFGQEVKQGQGKSVLPKQSQQSLRQQPPVKVLKKVDMPTAYRIWADWYVAQQQGIKKPVPTLNVLNASEKETNRLNAIWNKARLQAQSDLQRKLEQKPKLTAQAQSQSQEQTLIIDPRTNRITNPGYSYDAENRLITATVNGVVTSYFYDPLGRRVKKVVDGVTTRFIYDHEGKLIAEAQENSAPTTPSKEYIYGSSGLLAVIEPNPSASPTIKFMTSDHLNTPRVTTDAQGNVISRHDYFPFGQKITPDIGNRTSIRGYSDADSIRQKFTGYERDEETGLDFAQARYFSSIQGRFTSLDPLGKSEKLEDPQTWNRYAYVLNNPLRYTDPDGQAPQEGADIRQRQDIKDLMDGKISQQEYQDRQKARAVGAIIGAGIVGTGFFGVRVLPAFLAFLGRNPQVVQETADAAVQTATGNPLATSNRGVPMAGPATSVLTGAFKKSAGEIFSGGFNVGTFGKSRVDAAISQAGNTLYGALSYIEKLPEFSKGLSKVSDLNGFVDALKAVAKERGLSKLEFSVLAPNAKLEEQLVKQGYTKGSVTVSGETFSGYTKTIDVK
jgi:RHS repeat-associated protein